jgi:Fe-S-cluster containining protein
VERVTRTTCLTCGLCCIPLNPQQDAFCDVDEKDIKRLRGKARGRVVYPSMFESALSMIDGRGSHRALKTRLTKQTKGLFVGYFISRCTFLSGNLGHKVRCLVYKDRPRTCHIAMVPGNRNCRALRKFYKEQSDGLRRT